METVSCIARAFRSQKVSLGLKPGDRPSGYIRHSEKDVVKSLSQNVMRVSRMAGIGNVVVLNPGESAPKGTVQDVVDDKCVVFLAVAGANLEQEERKALKRLSLAEANIKSLENKMNAPGYLEKVPEGIREQNA